jgi:hypothetical protein
MKLLVFKCIENGTDKDRSTFRTTFQCYTIKDVGPNGRAVWGMYWLRPFEYWDHETEGCIKGGKFLD